MAVQCKKPKGVNYRHAYHAGNFADVVKHALLVRLIRSLQRKEKGFVVVDTHAGRGRYDLAAAAKGDTRARTPEWPDGIGRLWDAPDAPEEVADYLGVVRAFDRNRGNLLPEPRFYPGSPWIARLLSRPQDRLDLWEKHPEEGAALEHDFGGVKRISVHQADGYGASRASLPPLERRALVLVDPPYESRTEGADISAALSEAFERFPSGTYAVWYPITERSGVDEFVGVLRAKAMPSLCVELLVQPSGFGLRGCGVLIANPPWQFDGEARTILAYLEAKLARGEPAQGSVRWVVSK